jgi:hypothetical protein
MMESRYCACFVDDANHENGNDDGVEEVFRTTILGSNCLELQSKLMNQDWALRRGIG